MLTRRADIMGPFANGPPADWAAFVLSGLDAPGADNNSSPSPATSAAKQPPPSAAGAEDAVSPPSASAPEQGQPDTPAALTPVAPEAERLSSHQLLGWAVAVFAGVCLVAAL